MYVGRALNTVENRFLTRPIGRLFLSNARSIAEVISTSGLLKVVDGRFIGAEALAAISLALPVFVVLMALSALVGGGVSSRLARHSGAGSLRQAGAVFAGATDWLSPCAGQSSPGRRCSDPPLSPRSPPETRR